MKPYLKIFSWILFFLFILTLSFFKNSSLAEDFLIEEKDLKIVVFQENTLSSFSLTYKLNEGQKESSSKKILALITAYSSHPWQTDEDPEITAAGTRARDGIVANNFLPFGTKIKIPAIFGEKIFVVEDRMNWRKSKFHFDVWFENEKEALQFGATTTYIEILDKY